jgi:hypothetical protein
MTEDFRSKQCEHLRIDWLGVIFLQYHYFIALRPFHITPSAYPLSKQLAANRKWHQANFLAIYGILQNLISQAPELILVLEA